MATTNRVARKGMVTVEQGDGYPFKSAGTNFAPRDLDTLFNWFATGREPLKQPVRRDENGVPYRMCGIGQHDSPVAAFDKDEGTGELKPDCRQCLRDNADRIARAEAQISAEARKRHAEHERKKRRIIRAS